MNAFLFLVILASVSHAQQVKIITLHEPTSSTSFSFHEEEGAAQYVVGVAAGAADADPAPPAGRAMTFTSNNTRYKCYLPPAAQDTPNSLTTSTDDAPSTGTPSSSSPSSSPPTTPTTLHLHPTHPETPEDLMDELGDFCAYRVEDWWTYEVCYKKAARQYHGEGSKVTDQYFLGNYSAAASDMVNPTVDTELGGGGSGVKYVKQMYVDGDTCELTGKNRSVEVRFVCGRAGQQTVLTEVREPSSCSYVLTLATPRLCKHPAFQDKIPTAVPIVCYDMGGGEGEAGAGAGAATAMGLTSDVLGDGDAIPLLIDGDEYLEEEGEEGEDDGEEGSGGGAAKNNTTVIHADLDEDSEGLDEDGAVDGVKPNDLFGNPHYYDDYY